MTLKEWIKKHLGKTVKYNVSTKTPQCVDVAKSFCAECLDFYERFPELKKYWSFGNARDWYEGFNFHKELTSSFKRIANSSTFTPIAGDICVWTEGNKYGHIAVAYNDKSTTKKIYTVDQNYPTGSKIKYCIHQYTREGFLGVLRPHREIRAAVNIRQTPSTSGKLLGEYKAGTKIDIICLDGSKKWAKTKDGWIFYSYVKEI